MKQYGYRLQGSVAQDIHTCCFTRSAAIHTICKDMMAYSLYKNEGCHPYSPRNAAGRHTSEMQLRPCVDVLLRLDMQVLLSNNAVSGCKKSFIGGHHYARRNKLSIFGEE